MKLNKECRIEKVVANSNTSRQEALYNPYLQGHTLMGCNGAALVFLKVELTPGDTNGPVPVEAIKAARKIKGGGDILLNGSAQIVSGPSYERPKDVQYPNVEKVIPRKKAAYTVRIDPYLLADVAEAMGIPRGKGVTLEFMADPKGAFRINWAKENKAVMMTMR